MTTTLITRLVLLICLSAGVAHADVQALQSAWAKALYETPEDDRVDALTQLADEARSLVAADAGDAGALIWKGIILSTLAGEKGGLGALGLCKEARSALEAALEIDPTSLQGSAYTSLGSLYYQVPGWPIGFGDDEKAREYLEKALALNPEGIDPNYFMADFLHGEGDDVAALRYLDKAAHAPDRAGREVADRGRRTEIETLRGKIAAH